MNKDYHIPILYHLSKTNIVADELTSKLENLGYLEWLELSRRPLAREVQTLTNGFMRLQLTIK